MIKQLSNLSIEDINSMNYNEIIAITKETNRPPGGRITINDIITNLNITEQTTILEIGTSTGYSALEISRFVKCKIIAIDINDASLEEARARAKTENSFNIQFIKADVMKLPFEKDYFDIILIGNVFSLVSNKETALKECLRVLKQMGFIIAVPMYYVKKPSNILVQKVSEAIRVNITPQYKSDWDSFFKTPYFDLYMEKNYLFDRINDKKITAFVEDILARPHLLQIKKPVLEKLKAKYGEQIKLFRENLSHMGYTIYFLSPKRAWEDPELFTAKKTK
ncbi:TPA: class I SAM-dependent methyltransferase [Candidatus Woesearchaeota archaeon]|nr:class I SAM-dependent methyltransferase [Candidatus Woesearchaeota archaeon]HIH31967.1 class I SAM-dependent methyltransferase [Candidatus Woesearchaeota archaeon]HIH54484.1 class I SAM-dependent methyltransferase [Candidatus Woesearchaeota archaeon]HIJ02115.1 class I SAM-dependent methyltransferase [Candidatus Woesearchaeota archaeon]HIJ13163.1 class I SAM-dependent methyltransferase [Candidatus Woesearchaeota archaeon]